MHDFAPRLCTYIDDAHLDNTLRTYPHARRKQGRIDFCNSRRQRDGTAVTEIVPRDVLSLSPTSSLPLYS